MSGRWIKWAGGQCPVELDVLVDVKLREGTTMSGERAMEFVALDADEQTPQNNNWLHDGGPLDIVAYRENPDA